MFTGRTAIRTYAASGQTTSQSRASVKATTGLAGLAITGILLVACSPAAAGAAKPQPGQYRQAGSAVQAASQASERETLRQEHLGNVAAPARVKVSGTPAVNEREILRQEHLGNAAAPAKGKSSGTPAVNERESLRQEHLAK